MISAYTDAIRVSDFKANLAVLFVAIMMGPVVASRVGTRPEGIFGFVAGDSGACAEQIFHAVDNRLPEFAPQLDCLPALLDLYRHIGAAVTNGTSLATAR